VRPGPLVAQSVGQIRIEHDQTRRLLPVAAIVSENRSGPKMLENFSKTL